MHNRPSFISRVGPACIGFFSALLTLSLLSCSNDPTTSPEQTGDPLEGERINSFYTNEEIRYMIETTIGPASDSALLVKWYGGIRIYWEGDPTAEDTESIRNLAETMDKLVEPIDIRISANEPNVVFHFVPRDEYRFVEGGAYTDPYANGWMYYSYLDGITTVSILVPTDEYSTEAITDARILRGLGFAIGFRHITDDYPESMFYQVWNGVVEPALIDKTVIQMLYLPEIESGMDREQIIEAMTNR